LLFQSSRPYVPSLASNRHFPNSNQNGSSFSGLGDITVTSIPPCKDFDPPQGLKSSLQAPQGRDSDVSSVKRAPFQDRKAHLFRRFFWVDCFSIQFPR
jgi:hypothetical protein